MIFKSLKSCAPPAMFKKKDARPCTPDEALPKLENFCAYRERSPREVADKIRELGLHGEVAEQIFGLLHDEGFFNEARFARAFAGGKFRINHWGRVRIRLELRARGIAERLVAEALAEATPEAEYLAVFQQLMARKQAQLDRDDAENARQKLAAYLIRAGFEQELVFGALSGR